MLYDSKKWDWKGPPKYLTARQLDVSPKVRQAFIAVHKAMLADRIPEEQFNMADIGDPHWKYKNCGTAGCLQGWAQAYATEKLDNGKLPLMWYEKLRAGPFSRDTICELIDAETCFGELHELCYPHSVSAIRCRDPKVAREALGNWLTTGKANWSRVLREAKQNWELERAAASR